MQLQTLLAAIPGVILPEHPALDMDVTGLATNSHACKPGMVFIGMPGTRVDGGEFWQSAIAYGAIAAIISSQVEINQDDPMLRRVCLIQVDNVPQVCALLSAAFYGHPAQTLALTGVTGTNGKTTTTHLIDFFLTQAGQPTALFGTLYTRWAGHQVTASHTTPFAVELQHQLSQAVTAGCRYGVMEVSSHALAQGRVLECPFKVSVFTNLTQDHLDYHRDMEDYFAAKALLFNPTYLHGRAVINQDDPYGRRLLDHLPSNQRWAYSVTDASADLHTSDLLYAADGVTGTIHTPLGSASFQSPLVGQFNLANLLAAVGAGLNLGLDLAPMLTALPQFPGVPGRMERVVVTAGSGQQPISVIVDYAHTPDSLENSLKAARPFIAGRLICVFGCGGDRDRTKRPQMGKIAADLADWVVVTSDNPRTEEPNQILTDILAGIPESVEPLVLVDRAEAIRRAIVAAQPGDGVLIAGKGHEDYQILGTEKVHFDDREQARAALTDRLQADGNG